MCFIVAARQEEFAMLMNVRAFHPVEYGMDGDAISKQVVGVKTLSGDEDTREVFLDLIRRAENGGGLYVLCGLYRVDRRAFEKAVGRFVSDGSMVGFCGGGVVAGGVVMREVVCSSTGELDVMHGGVSAVGVSVGGFVWGGEEILAASPFHFPGGTRERRGSAARGGKRAGQAGQGGCEKKLKRH